MKMDFVGAIAGTDRLAGERWRPVLPRLHMLDHGLLISALLLLVWGMVMVASSSIADAERSLGVDFYYLWRQLGYASLGIFLALVVYQFPMRFWQQHRFLMLATAFISLVAVFVPGLGHEINGAQRWLEIGALNIQVSEVARLALMAYLASYLVERRAEFTLDWRGVVKPMWPILLACALLLAEPDYGATAILIAITLTMMFVAGARLSYVAGAVAVAATGLAVLAVASPYRMRRLVSFADPWQDPYNTGFQLSQALIAIGRGEWTGVGLGNSVQKLFYLPERHTDFIYAVLAEEFGLIGTLVLLFLFMWLVRRCFVIANRAQGAGQFFGTFVAYGIGTWLGLQCVINLGVNMGILPTKGLTLPFFSYGGSSMVAVCISIGLLLRIDYEALHLLPERQRKRAGA